MNKHLCKLVSAILVIVTVFCSIPFAVSSEEALPEYYGRYALSLEKNAEALLYAYDKITECVENSYSEISVYNGKDNISLDEFKMVIDVYRRDRGDHFWLDNGYSYRYSGNTILSYHPKYIMSGKTLESAKKNFENATRDMLSHVNDSMSDFQKALILHDLLAERITYTSSANAHNSYGALVEGKAVCEGYAESYQYLLQRAGIQSFLAIGRGNNAAHAWNYVLIDGKYYQTDLTWNDQKITYHAYFNQTTEVFLKDHSYTSVKYKLPECTATDAMYFNVKGGVIRAPYTLEKVAAAIKNSVTGTHLYLPDGSAEFRKWLKTNIWSVQDELGFENWYSYNLSYIGDEVYLAIAYECEHKEMTFVAEKKATCDEDGNSAYYICDCGKWFSDKNADREITDKNKVVVSAKGHSYGDTVVEPTKKADGYTLHTCGICGHSYKDSYVKYKAGDVSGDGTVDNNDAAKVLQVLAGWDVDCIDDALDVNGDGVVNNRDAVRLLQYAAGWDVEIN